MRDATSTRDGQHHGSDAIKVLIAEVPALLAAVVRQAVDEESDMAVVDQVESPEELREALHRPIDVVVTSSNATELGPHFQGLLFGSAPLPIVAISLDGERVDVYGRAITRGVGIDRLTRLIREAVTGARPKMEG